MNLDKYKRIVSPLPIGRPFLAGLFLWLNGASFTSRVAPDDLFGDWQNQVTIKQKEKYHA